MWALILSYTVQLIGSRVLARHESLSQKIMNPWESLQLALRVNYKPPVLAEASYILKKPGIQPKWGSSLA